MPMPEAGDLLAKLDEGDQSAAMTVAVAACHAEDAYRIALENSANLDAARIAMARAFLGSLAVGEPQHST